MCGIAHAFIHWAISNGLIEQWIFKDSKQTTAYSYESNKVFERYIKAKKYCVWTRKTLHLSNMSSRNNRGPDTPRNENPILQNLLIVLLIFIY